MPPRPTDSSRTLPFGNATTGAVTSYDDGTVGIVINYKQTEYQYISEEWLLVQENGCPGS